MIASNHDEKNVDWGKSDGGEKYRAQPSLVITQENKLIYVIGIISLSIAVLGTISCIFWLALSEKDIPQALIAIGSIAVAGLCSLFTQNK
jgi:hypothetical protein